MGFGSLAYVTGSDIFAGVLFQCRPIPVFGDCDLCFSDSGMDGHLGGMVELQNFVNEYMGDPNLVIHLEESIRVCLGSGGQRLSLLGIADLIKEGNCLDGLEMFFWEQNGQGSGLCFTIVWLSGKGVSGGIGLSSSWDNLEFEEGEELSPSALSSIEWVWFLEVSKVLVVCVNLKFLSVEVMLPFLESSDNCQHFQVIDIIIKLGVLEFHRNTIHHLP